MTKYTVIVSYTGTLEYEIEAADGRSAAKEGLAKFEKASLEDVSSSIEADDVEVRDRRGVESRYGADTLPDE